MTNKIETLPHNFNSKEVQNPLEFTFYGGAKANLISFEVRKSILKTAELAGFTVSKEGQRHYLLADVALVGEAITLAMRTTVPWKF